MGEIQIISHAAQVKRATERAMKQAAEMIGGTLAGHAIEYCPVDTGLLRNSITYAIGGEEPKLTTYKSNNRDKNGKEIEVVEGTYSGIAPQDDRGTVTVYVGTNVEYAPYVEMGHIQAGSGKHVAPQPYIKPAIVDHLDEYKTILANALKGE